MVLGGDGYLGWPTALHLSEAGHEVAVADNFVRRHYDNELGVESLVPIEPLYTRLLVIGQPLTVYGAGWKRPSITTTSARQAYRARPRAALVVERADRIAVRYHEATRPLGPPRHAPAHGQVAVSHRGLTKPKQCAPTESGR